MRLHADKLYAIILKLEPKKDMFNIQHELQTVKG